MNAPTRPLPNESVNVHTTRCILSIEAQIRLLALPMRPFNHTPFGICMIVTGAIPLLSACKFLLKGHKLAVARNQIRFIIGCLKSFAQVWPHGAKSLHEIQEIARLVLVDTEGEGAETLESRKRTTRVTIDPVPLSNSSSSQSPSDPSSTLSSLDALDSFWTFGDLQVDPNQWLDGSV
jgi:hypothetical protein